MKLFERKPDPKEQIRASQRDLTKGSRDLQREMLHLQREEQKLIADIKKTAKKGDTQATKTLAKSLVRLRGQMNQLRASEAHLRGVKYAVTTSSATSKVAQSMDSASKAMAAVGQANDPKAIQKIMQEFSKENMKMDMSSEMMEDALDSAFDNDETEGETDEVMNEVLDSIGVDIGAQIGSAPRTKMPAKAATTAQPANEEDDDIAARLAALK